MTAKTHRFEVPGSGQSIEYARDESSGRLLAIEAKGRRYLTVGGDGVAVWEDGWLTVNEFRGEGGFTRRVEAAGECWSEHYRWGDDDRIAHVDGVDVRRDERGRVVACLPGGEDPAPDAHRWLYAYACDRLVAIEGPEELRHLTVDAEGRVTGWRSGGESHRIEYTREGRRRDIGTLPPQTHHRDDAGRLWTVKDPEGRILATFLWDGFRCLARVDGALGEPIGAVFSLDPSATPVRVCTPHGSRRIARDAFGAGLLGQHGVPGLFGGAVHRGFVHLPWRVLDPASGSFCAPDPFDGSESDPRRGPDAAYTGELPVEHEGFGPYAVCRHDPIGRGDPSGAISAGLVISSLTWSLQNNLLSFFAMDWWANMIASLVTGCHFGDALDTEGLVSSDRLGAFGLRRDGVIATDRAFTTQHIVWCENESFERLLTGRVIDPRGEFEPTLYGTLLLGRPADEIPIVLRGMAHPGGVHDDHRAVGWSRAGGAARPAVPGARAPKFPAGGFHMDRASTTRRIVDCPLSEVEPGAGVALGDFEARATIDVADTSRAPAVGDTLLLLDGNDDLVITRVASAARDSGRVLLRLKDDAPSVGPDGVTLRKLDGAAVTSDSRPAAAGLADGFAAAAGGTAYAAGDLLKLTAGGGHVTVGRVDRLEVRLPLDRALPASLGSAIQVIATTVASSVVRPRRRSEDTLEFESGTPPGTGDFGLLRGNGNELPVRVVASVNATTVRVDASLSALAAADAEVDYHAVTAGASIGRRSAAVETEARVTYTPNASGQAPDGSSGSVVLRFDGDGDPVLRRVTGAPSYDAVVLDRTPAGSAPWTVERYRVAADNVDLTGLTIVSAASIVARPASVLENAQVLMLQRLDGDPATANDVPGLPQLDLAGQTGTATLPAAATAGSDPAAPRPGQVVILQGGGSREEALVQRVRLAVTFEDDLDVQERDLQAVLLQPQGPDWIAHRVADRRVVLEPFARTGATAAVDVDFPRFTAGETVRVTWDDSGTVTGHYRVIAVSGTTLDLAGEPVIPATAGDVRVERLVPGDADTGGVLLARDGERVGAAPTRKITFSVWKPNDMPRTRLVGIVSGDIVIPTRVDDVDQDLEVTFAAAPSLTGPVDLDVPTVQQTRYAARFVREGDALIISDETGGLEGAAGAHTLAVVPFVASDRSAASGQLHPGSLRIPADEEAPEIDRKQSLVDHELAHTLQYARFGPIWFNIFPMLALELPAEFTSNTELPEYSEFQPASVTSEGTGWRLAFTGTSIELSSGDVVQIVRGGNFGRAEVDSVEGGNILLKRDDDNGPPPTGAVQVRRRNANDHWDRTFNVFGVLTHGGLMNLTVGNTWGGLLWLLSKGVYGIYRAIAGTGELYDAQVRSGEGENAGREIELSSEGARQAIQNGNRIMVRQGESTVVRTVSSRTGNVVTLDQRVSFTDAVKVAPYSAHDPGSAFDWLDYHPATIPDLGNPAVIELAATGGDALELSPRDRVEILYRDGGKRNNVVSVAGNTIQLENGIHVENEEASLRIAKIDSTDPMGNADSAGLVEMGMGWMQWLFDPWGQLQLDLQPRETWLNITTRIIRYAFGTQMWSLIPFGYVWWERLFPLKAEHLSAIEQEASEESGDLYSPLGRLTGQASSTDDFARYEMLVGDVARYRYWLLDSDTGTVIQRGQQDAPGVHLNNDSDDDIRIIPHRADRGGSGVLNAAVQADASSTAVGRSVPDLFTAKRSGDPNQLVASVTDPASFVPADLGYVPTDPTTERCIASYVAFCEPGDHRVTVRDAVFGAQRGRDTQDAERQPLFFELTVSDVELRVAGQLIPRQAAVQRIELVQTQEVALAVSPNAGRQYRVTVQRPVDGPTLRATGNLTLQARTTDGTERVEISRYYAYDEASGSYANGGLSGFGLHLGADVHIAVGQLDVEVVSTFPLRASADPTAGASTSLAQGSSGFLLVPAAIITPPRLQSFDGRAPAGGDPDLTIRRVASPPEAATRFVGSGGGVFEVSFASSPAVTGSVPVRLEVTVGTPGEQTAVLTCGFDLGA